MSGFVKFDNYFFDYSVLSGDYVLSNLSDCIYFESTVVISKSQIKKVVSLRFSVGNVELTYWAVEDFDGVKYHTANCPDV